MSLLNTIKDILGFNPPNTGTLDHQATHSPKPAEIANFPTEATSDIEITDDYRKAVALIEAQVPIVFVTGRAGTGKSTFIQFLRNQYEGVIAVVAPTGVAALNAGGVTIHSFFRFPPRVVNPEDVQLVGDNRLYKALKILVVDEVSMVRADHIDAMDQFLRLNGRSRDLPFGGIQVILVGDLAQLPPVVGTEEESALFSRRYHSPFFFSAEALAESVMAPIELMRVFRQTDARFIEILSRIRLGETSDEILAVVNSRVGQSLPTPAPVMLTPTNDAADLINQNGLRMLEGEEALFVGIIEGTFKIEGKKLPAPLHLKLKRNARVMFTKNDGEKRWVNGTLGVVRDFTADKISVEIEERGRGIVDVGCVRWEQYKFVYDSVAERVRTKTVGEFIQFPLQPAWAITIHKAQGKTLPAVHIDLGRGAFAAGQTYVALSRARSLDTIWLETPINRSDISCDKRIAAFYRGLFGEREGGSGFEETIDNGPVQQCSKLPMEEVVPVSTPSQTELGFAEVITAAIEDGNTIQMAYCDYSGNETTRTVRPRAWVDEDRFTAFCELRGAERDFRVSRIVNCLVLD